MYEMIARKGIKTVFISTCELMFKKKLMGAKSTNRYFIKLSFKGTNYHGWQMQKNANSIQDVLNKALTLMLGEKINVVGCGRTDAGVHAKEFFAHFDTKYSLTEKEIDQLVFKLNKFLPKDIAIFNIYPVRPDAHARFDAITRTYQYIITQNKDPFNQEFAFYYYGSLNVDLMNKGAEILFEYDDFTSFSKLHTQVKNNICKIIDARWEKKDQMLIFTIKADRFLRNMVRAIVGTLIDLGIHKITLDDIREIIEQKDRSAAGRSVPANGLFLTKITYPEEIFHGNKSTIRV